MLLPSIYLNHQSEIVSEADMIEVAGLTHIYNKDYQGGVTALSDVDLEVSDGEFVAVLGANGSGKSTLVKHFNGLLLPTSGNVTVDGLNTKDAQELLKIRQKVGFIFQNPDNQIVATVVEEDVAFGPENLGLDPEDIKKRVDEALAAVGAEGLRALQPHFISQGEKQRVAIAGVLALRPKYLVLDEPTSQLDPSCRRETLNLIRELNKARGVTVVYVTHFTDEVIEADRVVVMSKGKVALEGSPKDILSNYSQLEKLGVRAPHAAVLADRLSRAGLDVPGDILTVEGLVDSLCSLN